MNWISVEDRLPKPINELYPESTDQLYLIRINCGGKISYETVKYNMIDNSFYSKRRDTVFYIDTYDKEFLYQIDAVTHWCEITEPSE